MAERPNETVAWERTPLGKILRVMGTGERFGVQHIVRPLVRRLAPEAEQKLQERGGDIYGGDVYAALRPGRPRLENALMGALLGGAVDPLSYLGVGELTSAGREAEQAGKLALTGVERAKQGQQALLQARLPFSSRTLAQVPQGLNVAAARLGETLQQGHAAQQVLSRVGLPKLGAFYDNFTNNISQKFGFNIGADPWLMHTHQELFSHITGASKLQTEKVVDSLEPMFEETARRFAARLDIPVEEAYAKVKAASFASLDAHPEIVAARQATGMVLGRTPYRSHFERARTAVQNSFGLPPTWGGPASPLDTDLLREVRKINVVRKRINKNYQMMDEQRLGHELRLLTHPDAGYQYGMFSQETKDWLKKYNQDLLKDTVIGGRGQRDRGYMTPPSTHMAAEIGRRMRTVDGKALQLLQKNGLLPNVTLGGKTVNVAGALAQDIGRPISKYTQTIVNALFDQGLDPAAIGALLPAIPNQLKNQWIWEHGYGVIPPNTIKSFFESDPTVLDAARGMQSQRTLLSDDWFNAVKEYGRRPEHIVEGIQPLVVKSSDPVIPQGWQPVKGVPELAGYHIAPDEGKFLARYYATDLKLGDFLKPFMEGLHNANTAFKAWTLAPFPAYHTRNFVQGLWSYFLSSPNPVEYTANLGRSASAWKAIRGGKNAARNWTLRGVTNPLTGKEWNASEIWREVEGRTGWGVGFVSAEPDELARHVARLKKHGMEDPERMLLQQSRQPFEKNWLDTQARSVLGQRPAGYVGPPPPKVAERIKLGVLGHNGYIENGFRVGSYVDDRIRMAHVIQELRQGHPIYDAITTMKKYQFDYHQLSPFEKTWMKELIPFYAWSRKNIPFQLEMLVRRPDRAARFNGFLQGWQGWDANPDEAFMSKWMQQNFPVRTRKNKQGQTEYLLFKNWLPMADINDLFHMQDWALTGLTPYAKIPLEQIANTNFLTDRKIDNMNARVRVGGAKTQIPSLSGEREPFFGVNTPTRVTHLLKSIRIFNTLHTWVDNPQELDLASHALRAVVGRTYPLDVSRSSYELQQDLDDLNTGMRRSVKAAIFRGNDTEVTRLVEQYLKEHQATLQERGLVQPEPKKKKK